MKQLLFFILCFSFVPHAIGTPQIKKTSLPNWLYKNEVITNIPDLDSITSGYYYELIESQTHLATQTTFYRDVRVIYDNSGAENAGSVYITFDPKYQEVFMHQLQIVRENDTINKLNVADIKVVATETDLASFVYNGSYTAYIIIDDLRKDDKIIYSYSTKGFNPVFNNVFSDKTFLQGYEPIGKIFVNYITPKERKLNIKTFGDAPAYQLVTNNNGNNYFWEKLNPYAVLYEENTPLWFPSRMEVQCSEYNNWTDVANWATKTNPILPLASGSDLMKKADAFWKESNEDISKYTELVCHFVQNEIRYMGIEIGQYSHMANKPERVFSQRYGDCKDKSVLLVSMLRYKGIKSDLILANTYYTQQLEYNLPTPLAFNHMITKLVYKGKEIFVDPTITMQGGDFYNRNIPFYGKMFNIHSAQWETPLDNIEGKSDVKEYYILDKKGNVKLLVISEFSGYNCENIRRMIKQDSKAQIEKLYKEFYTKLYPNISTANKPEFKDDLENNILTIIEEYNIKDFKGFEKSSNKNYITTYASTVSSFFPEIANDRKYPIDIQYPLNSRYELIIINPNGIDVNINAYSIEYNTSDYSFTKKISSKKDSLFITYESTTYNDFISAQNINTYFDDFKDRDNLFVCSYYLNDDGAIVESGGIANNSSISYISLFILLLSTILFYLFLKKYNTSKPRIVKPYAESHYNSLGGWLILLLILTVLKVLKAVYDLINGGYYHSDMWDAAMSLNKSQIFPYYVIVFLELLLNMFFIWGFIYSIYLMIKRRDIFPQTMIILLISSYLFLLLDQLGVYFIFNKFTLETKDLYPMIGIVLWSAYLYQSHTVKGTFVVKYNDNIVNEPKNSELYEGDELQP